MGDSEQHPTRFFKFCPHCGSNNFKALSVKELCCGSCGFDFFTNSAAAVAAIIVAPDGRIMLTQRAVEPWKGTLDLPGGFVDPDETAEEALARELKEELDAEIASCEYFTSTHNRYLYSGCSIATTDLAFTCHLNNYEHLNASDDINSFAWFETTDIPLDRILSPSIREIVERYIKRVSKCG